MERNEIRLGIGWPLSGRLLDKDFTISFLGMEKPQYRLYLPEKELAEFCRDISIARNSLVRQARAEGCTHLVMMDTDQIYPPDTVRKLLSHGKDVVGVNVHRRYPPYAPIMQRGEIGKWKYVPEEEMFSGELIEVDATGGGCLCFNLDVFDALDPPWFEFSEHEGAPVGEDIFLCSKLRAAGIRIFVDTSIHVGHIGQIIIDRGFYEHYKALTGANLGT